MTTKANVEQLPSYGKAFDHMPLQAQILQVRVAFAELRQKVGLLGMVRFVRDVHGKQQELQSKYGELVTTKFREVPASAIRELYMASAMYLVISEREGQEAAYSFLRRIFQAIGPTAHEMLYDVQGLVQCEGDVFDNFCKLNRSIFENSAKKGFYNVDEIQDSRDLQYIRLTKCLNVDAFSTLGCPKLARLGCDIDIAGYAPHAMGDKVGLDFRRPCTLVNGDESCEFHYYRKGHAPADMRTI